MGTVYNGEDYSEIKYLIKGSTETDDTLETRFTKAKEYYGKIYTKTGEQYNLISNDVTYSSDTTYYAKIIDKFNDNQGCGLTYNEYNSKKSKMLQSIKNNGGFFIGRYEVGYLEGTKRIVGNANTAPTQIPVIKHNAYPYNWITCSQAEKLAESLSSESSDKTTSLMFGLQWDLVLRFLNSNGVSRDELIINSITWGNYKNSEFKVDRGEWAKYESIGDFYKFNDATYYDNNYFNRSKKKMEKYY